MEGEVNTVIPRVVESVLETVCKFLKRAKSIFVFYIYIYISLITNSLSGLTQPLTILDASTPRCSSSTKYQTRYTFMHDACLSCIAEIRAFVLLLLQLLRITSQGTWDTAVTVVSDQGLVSECLAK